MNKTSIFSFDLLLFAATLSLIVIGILFIYSSGVTSTGIVFSREFIKQIIWAGTGLVLMALVVTVSYTRMKGPSIYLYGFCCLVLLVTPFVGLEVKGARSWLGIGDVGIQPSEFAKMGTIIFLAAYLSGIGQGIKELPRFFLAFGIVLLPMGLILLQPDLGTALVYIPIFLVMVFMAGARLRHLFYLIAAGFLMVVLGLLPFFESKILGREAGVLALITHFDLLKYFLTALLVVGILSAWGYWGLKRRYFYWILYVSSLLFLSNLGGQAINRVLKDYQIMRLIVFLKPSLDPQGAGWNIIQSITAVGSGGFTGKGFLQGTQSHYQFLPQQSTDFVFSILAEEWGFLGGLLVFTLFLIILLRGIRIMYTARDDFSIYIAAGIVGMLFFHVIVNVGMAMGIMPITGIPLFFLSYGGSSLWTALSGIGLLLNIHARRYRQWS